MKNNKDQQQNKQKKQHRDEYKKKTNMKQIKHLKT